MAKKYKVNVAGHEIIFRDIYAEESDRFIWAIRKKDPIAEELVFREILHESCDINIDELPAGVIPTIVYSAIKLSGYFPKESDIPNIIDNARKSIQNNFFSIFYATIIKAQPSYRIDELQKKSLDDLLAIYAFSEKVLGKETINTDEMRKTLKKEKEKEKGVAKSAGGLSSISTEELELVKSMISSEEFNSEMF
jgi:hypothetical protein